MNFVDPFGAPEFFCNDMILEQVAPGLIRVRMIAHENGESILRCTLLLPESALTSNMARTKSFMEQQPKRTFTVVN